LNWLAVEEDRDRVAGGADGRMEQAHDEATATRLIRPAQACSCQASTIAADVPFRWVLGTALTEWDKATTH
jgi:hypothetical protein